MSQYLDVVEANANPDNPAAINDLPPQSSTTKTMTTYTIESVHGLKQTFAVLPNGTVDTTQAHVKTSSQESSQSSDQSRDRDTTR